MCNFLNCTSNRNLICFKCNKNLINKMGTRSLIRFRYYDGTILCCIYQQWDGYPSCVGIQLAKFLCKMIMVNGIPSNANLPEGKQYANGIECLVAQFIAAYKKGPGSLYLYPHDSCDQEYNYDVKLGQREMFKEGKILVKCLENEGGDYMTPEKFYQWCENYSGSD